ncbi:MAG: KilA-N domain-containing protein [Hymenobacter sp.]|nr:MAG: KilA-N domain-containing protein [Hymenobacter sp.]
MKNERVITVKDHHVQIYQARDSDYLNLVHLASAYTDDEDNAAQTVSNWIRTRNTMDFLAEWEKLYSDGQFQEAVYEQHAADSSKGTFSMSAQKWVDTTQAVGIVVRRGRTGGIYAHEDIALEFSTWLNPLFKLYVVKEFQRLKQEEGLRNSQDWQLKRMLSKANYRLHTDAVKATIVDNLPSSLTGQQRKWKEGYIYASEADIINKVLEQKERFEFLADQAASMFVALSGTPILNRIRATLSPLQGITSPPVKREELPLAKPEQQADAALDPQGAPDAIPAPPIIKKLPSLRDIQPPTAE